MCGARLNTQSPLVPFLLYRGHREVWCSVRHKKANFAEQSLAQVTASIERAGATRHPEQHLREALPWMGNV
jgi:hypothetical protein